MNARSSQVSLVRKILVTLAVGAVTYLVLNLVTGGLSRNERTLLNLTLPVMIGAVVFLVQFLADVDRRLDAVAASTETDARETREWVLRELHAVNEATELFGQVEASALRPDSVTALVRNATRIDPASPALIHGFAQAEIARVTDLLRTLGEGGDITYEGEDRDWLLSLTGQVQASIDATSVIVVDARGGTSADSGLWLSDLGYRYLEAQREAIRRGVAIRRIFVLDRPALIDDPALRRIVDMHRSFGIQVRALGSTSSSSTTSSPMR
jgi:hypothetical protein